jgi:hypothetical protein
MPSARLRSAAVVPGGSIRASGPTRAVDRKSSAAILHVVFDLRDSWPSNQHERCMP